MSYDVWVIAEGGKEQGTWVQYTAKPFASQKEARAWIQTSVSLPCAPGWIRTSDLTPTEGSLCPLSYGGWGELRWDLGGGRLWKAGRPLIPDQERHGMVANGTDGAGRFLPDVVAPGQAPP